MTARADVDGWGPRGRLVDRNNAPGVVRVFLPLDDAEFIVDGETIFYKERYHSAVLLQPAFDLMAVLTLIVWATLDIGLTRTWTATLMAIGSIIVLRRFILQLRYSWKRPLAIAVAVVLLAITLELDLNFFTALIVAGFVVRFALHWVRWAFYRKLYITNRRVIEIDGLIGSSVATMPLFRITDALLQRTALAEILGYALFKIESAGQDQALGSINFLQDAERFQRLIVRLSTSEKNLAPPGDGVATSPEALSDASALDRRLD